MNKWSSQKQWRKGQDKTKRINITTHMQESL